MKNRKSPKNTSSVLSVESEKAEKEGASLGEIEDSPGSTVLSVESEKAEKEGASLAEIEDSPGSTEGSSEGGSP